MSSLEEQLFGGGTPATTDVATQLFGNSVPAAPAAPALSIEDQLFGGQDEEEPLEDDDPDADNELEDDDPDGDGLEDDDADTAEDLPFDDDADEVSADEQESVMRQLFGDETATSVSDQLFGTTTQSAQASEPTGESVSDQLFGNQATASVSDQLFGGVDAIPGNTDGSSESADFIVGNMLTSLIPRPKPGVVFTINIGTVNINL